VRDQLPGYLKPLIETLYLTGWRRGEVLSRQWKHIDFAKGWLRLEPGQSKNRQGRMFPLTAELRAVLEAQRERVREIENATGTIIPWVFVRDDGAPIRGLRKAWATACKRAGVGKKLIHDFRRTAVRNLERSGVSRSAAMRMTGHLTESVYRRYAIVSESDLREARDKLAALHATDRNVARKVVPLTVGAENI
jgi:integrase